MFPQGRTLQYAEQMRSGYLEAGAAPRTLMTETGVHHVDGAGIGIPAMWLAYEESMKLARQIGISALAVRKVSRNDRERTRRESRHRIRCKKASVYCGDSLQINQNM